MRTINTQNSTYELDEDSKRVRRLSGAADPTPYQGADGEWKDYEEVSEWAGGLLFVWDGYGKSTLTSPVIDG